MKEKMARILETSHRYNSANMAYVQYGFDQDVVYDALVMAPTWKPNKIIKDPSFHVTILAEHSYISSYLVEREGLKIAWVQTASGASRMIDSLTITAELKVKKLVFAGAVGSLSPKYDIGELCTPEYSIEGVMANGYLCDRLSDYVPFGKVYPDAAFVGRVTEMARECGIEVKKAPVFCTDSISLEYMHLDEIRATGAELIEMETSTVFRMAQLMEVPAVALMVVSDNSATGAPLIGKSEEQETQYDRGRKEIIPELIYRIASMK